MRSGRTSLALLIVVGGSVLPVKADCASFYLSFNDQDSVSSNGCGVFGSLGFVPGVNGNAGDFDGNARVICPDPVFNAASGSISLWFRKNSADAQGGIVQIGILGQPNSLGIFYDGQNNIRFEMRNDSSAFTAVGAEGVLSQTTFTHIVAKWLDRGTGCDMWLYLDGGFVAYGFLPGLFVHNAGQVQLGTTGFYGNAEGAIDEFRYFDWPLLDGEIYAENVFSANRYLKQPGTKPVSTGNVRLIGDDLYVSGRLFRVKGVGYAPTPIGEWPSSSTYNDPGIIARDTALLRGMNVNTIRLWAQPPDTALLDACYNGGVDPIYVIVGFWVPLDPGVDYSDPATIASIENDFRSFVNQFKDHPAVLAWGIGNENNFAYQGDVSDWYALAESLAAIAYAEEGPAYHPTIVVNSDLRQLGDVALGSDDASLGSVDIWGHNVYFGSDAYCYFDYYRRLTAKPMIATEYGIDAWDDQGGVEYPSVQAQWVVQQWRQIKANSLGATVMAYADEWWKATDPNNHDFGGYATPMHPDGYSNEEWWGMVRPIDDGPNPDIMQPRQVYYDLAAEYADVSGDSDGDDDVDLADFAEFQRCIGLPAAGPCGDAFEFVVDGVISGDDYTAFQSCLAGANQLPACPP